MSFESRIEKQREALEQQRQNQAEADIQRQAEAQGKIQEEEARIEAIKQDPRWQEMTKMINSPDFIEAMDIYCEVFSYKKKKQEKKKVRASGLSGLLGATQVVYESFEEKSKPPIVIREVFDRSFENSGPFPVGYIEIEIDDQDHDLKSIIIITWRGEPTNSETKVQSTYIGKGASTSRSTTSGLNRQAGLAIEVPTYKSKSDTVTFEDVFYNLEDFLDFLAQAVASGKFIRSNRPDNSY